METGMDELIQEAITYKRPQVLTYVSELQGFNPDMILPNGLTPLVYSVEKNLPEYVNCFLYLGADPNQLVGGVSSLHVVAAKEPRRSPKIIKYLLEDPRTDPNIYTQSDIKTTPLISSIIDNNITAVKLLLDDPRTDVNRPMKGKYDKFMPLQIAMQTDKTPNKKIVELLLQHGAVMTLPSSR